MASIRKRGHLQWEARIRRKGYPITCKTFELKSDAEKWAREIEGEMDRGSFVSRSEAESTTLKEAFDRYLSECIPKFANPRNEGNRVKAMQRRAICTKILAAIRGKDVADYILEREADGMSGNSIRLEINTISKLFKTAITSWGMESLVNPVSKVQKPKVNPGR
ncbi:MAG: site-specific integrase, partial [Deltaproteobacteria bacterium]|nr:site-specific integrase [Deltaproteobacteria bacterium]